MADVTEVIKRLIVEAQTRGLDKAAADFEKFGTAAKQAATTSENALASTGKSFERLAGSIDPARKQLQLLAKDLATLESGRGRAGVSDEYINGLKQARIETANLAIEATKTNAAIGAQANGMAKLGPAVGLARHEMINFSRQAQDVFVQLASGQSAIMTFVQQGPQIADVFTTSQGSLKGFAGQMGSLALRFGPVIAGLGAVATAVYAVNKALDEQLESRQALGGGRGRFLGATPGDISRAAERTAGSGVSLGEAREGILAGVRAGGPDMRTIQQAEGLARRYATTIQSEVAPAQKELAELIGDRTTRSYEAVSKKLGAYNADVADNIRQLQSQGQFAAAAKAAIDGIEGALVKSADSVTVWGRAWAYSVTQMQKGLEVAGRIATFTPPGTDTDAGKRAADQQRAIARPGFDTAIKGESRRGSGPSSAFAEEMRASAEALSQENEAVRKVTEQLALDQTNTANAIRKATEAQRDQIAVMSALTIEQKAAATGTQVYNQLILEGKDAEEARARATLASQMVIAQAANEMTRALQAQQAQIDGLKQLEGAVGQGATAMAVLTAKLQEEQSLRAAGINIMSAEAQQRIANAGTIAKETAALQDQVKARQVLQQARGQVQVLKAEAGMINAASASGTYGDPRADALRERNLSILKGQIEARRLSQEGLTEEAAAVRKSSKAVAQATYARDTARINAQEAAAHAKELAELGDYGAYRAINQGIDPSAMKQILAAEKQQQAADDQAAAAYRQQQSADAFAGFARASTFATKWAPKTQEATITGPPGTKPVVWGGGGFKTQVKFVPFQSPEEMQQEQEKREGGQKQQKDLARQTLGTAISSANAALGKQIEALRNATERSTDAQNKRTELEGKLKEQEDKRQSRIQNYLAAGPSPFEQNADIFYDPKKRMAFAETIAGGIDEQLKVQIAAAKAEADAADAAQKSAEAQIAKLQDQQQALQDQSELLSAGVDLSKAEVDGINALIQEIQSGLPENIAAQFARIMGAQMGQANKQSADIQKSTGVGGGSYSTQVLNQTAGTSGGTTSPFGSYSASAFDPYNTTSRLGGSIGGFASGGEFTVPGTYGAGDRPFVMGLAGQEKVTIQTPGQQRSGGSRGTSIENLIVQMPPMTDPIVYLNKRSRPALGRAIRNTARGMN